LQNLAICLGETGSVDEAWTLFATQLHDRPRDVGAMLNIAHLETLRGRPDAARGYLAQARALCDGPAAAVERVECERLRALPP
jgi:Flp pilus assembly protein TadD